jgi:hypothetical protein
MSYGVESGVQEILDNIKKRTTVEQIRQAFEWTREAGIESMAHIVLGLPGESPETIEATKQLIHEIQPDYVQFYGAIPFPGTEFYRMAMEEGWLITDDWSRFEINQAIVSTPQLSAEQLEEARKTAFNKFYLQPSYMWSKVTEIRSVGESPNWPRSERRSEGCRESSSQSKFLQLPSSLSGSQRDYRIDHTRIPRWHYSYQRQFRRHRLMRHQDQFAPSGNPRKDSSLRIYQIPSCTSRLHSHY